MTAFVSQLTSQEIEAVVDYILTTFMPGEAQTPASTGATGASMAVMGKPLQAAGIAGESIKHGMDFDLPMPGDLKGDTGGVVDDAARHDLSAEPQPIFTGFEVV